LATRGSCPRCWSTVASLTPQHMRCMHQSILHCLLMIPLLSVSTSNLVFKFSVVLNQKNYKYISTNRHCKNCFIDIAKTLYKDNHNKISSQFPNKRKKRKWSSFFKKKKSSKKKEVKISDLIVQPSS
jgi:hypothetical protein